MESGQEQKGKCDRCGVVIVGEAVFSRDNNIAHKDPLACIAYILQKIWLVQAMMLNTCRSVEQAADKVVDYLAKEDRDAEM